MSMQHRNRCFPAAWALMTALGATVLPVLAAESAESPSASPTPSAAPAPSAPAPSAETAPSAAIAVVDDLGRRVQLTHPAQRIVTLAPFLTELAFSADVGPRVVAVSAWSDYPSEARALPVVSSAGGISIEGVAAARPDLVLAWRDSMKREDITRLESMHIAVYVASGRRLADVPHTLRAIGALAAVDVEPAAKDFESRISALRAAHGFRAPVDVFLEINEKPLMTISGTHFMNEALAACGARNVFAGAQGVAPVVSLENLLERNPVMIVGIGVADSQEQFAAQWAKYPTLSAVKGRRLILGDANRLERPTLRTADGIAELCTAIDAKRPSA